MQAWWAEENSCNMKNLTVQKKLWLLVYICHWEDDFLFHNYCSAVRMSLTGRWKTTEQRSNRYEPPSSVPCKQQEKHATLCVPPLNVYTLFHSFRSLPLCLFRLVDLYYIHLNIDNQKYNNNQEKLHSYFIFNVFPLIFSTFNQTLWPMYTVIIHNK